MRCKVCDFKTPSQRKMVEHVYSEHKNRLAHRGIIPGIMTKVNIPMDDPNMIKMLDVITPDFVEVSDGN